MAVRGRYQSKAERRQERERAGRPMAYESEDIPDEAFRPVYERIWIHTIAITRGESGGLKHDEVGRHHGMGTLVQADGSCILTAAHGSRHSLVRVKH